MRLSVMRGGRALTDVGGRFVVAPAHPGYGGESLDVWVLDGS